MRSNVLKVVGLMVMTMSMTAFAGTVAYWNFEDGTAGQPFTPAGQANGSGGSADTVNGTMMYGWDNYYGPSFSTNTSGGAGNNLSMRNAGNHQDGYTSGSPVNSWAPSVWTIECSVFLLEKSGWETLIGRDGSSQSEWESDFYLSNNGIDDKFRINIDTVGGQRWILDGDASVGLNRWYGLAVTSDGATMNMYLDDSSGYRLIGSLDISAQTLEQNALAQNGQNWTFGRGWYNGEFVDHIDGYMDDIRFSDTVLSTSEMIGVVIPEPATLVMLGFGAAALLRKRR